MTDEEAPNCFVSVLVIKGSEASARKFKEPQLRLGYCELMVENVRDRLQVEITAEDERFIDDLVPPGEHSGKGFQDPAYPIVGRGR